MSSVHCFVHTEETKNATATHLCYTPSPAFLPPFSFLQIMHTQSQIVINNKFNILFGFLYFIYFTVLFYLKVFDTLEFVNDGVVIHKLCIACNRAIGRFTGAASGIYRGVMKKSYFLQS
jgi:hypothetical protein